MPCSIAVVGLAHRHRQGLRPSSHCLVDRLSDDLVHRRLRLLGELLGRLDVDLDPDVVRQLDLEIRRGETSWPRLLFMIMTVAMAPIFRFSSTLRCGKISRPCGT